MNIVFMTFGTIGVFQSHGKLIAEIMSPSQMAIETLVRIKHARTYAARKIVGGLGSIMLSQIIVEIVIIVFVNLILLLLPIVEIQTAWARIRPLHGRGQSACWTLVRKVLIRGLRLV